MSIDISAIRQRAKMKLHGINDTVTLSRQGASYWMCQPAVGVDPDNPFKSAKQRKFLYSQKPEVAKKFAKHTGGPVKDPVMTKKQMKKQMKKGMK